MYLQIHNPEHFVLEDFLKYLMRTISEYGFQYARSLEDDAKRWNDYFKENDFGWMRDMDGNPMPPTFMFIVTQYFDNLKYRQNEDGYIIDTDPSAKLGGSDATVDEIARVINYGNLDMEACDVFDRVFDYFGDNLNDIYWEWEERQV